TNGRVVDPAYIFSERASTDGRVLPEGGVGLGERKSTDCRAGATASDRCERSITYRRVFTPVYVERKCISPNSGIATPREIRGARSILSQRKINRWPCCYCQCHCFGASPAQWLYC